LKIENSRRTISDLPPLTVVNHLLKVTRLNRALAPDHCPFKFCLHRPLWAEFESKMIGHRNAQVSMVFGGWFLAFDRRWPITIEKRRNSVLGGFSGECPDHADDPGLNLLTPGSSPGNSHHPPYTRRITFTHFETSFTLA
jgi:hypothetical protein